MYFGTLKYVTVVYVCDNQCKERFMFLHYVLFGNSCVHLKYANEFTACCVGLMCLRLCVSSKVIAQDNCVFLHLSEFRLYCVFFSCKEHNTRVRDYSKDCNTFFAFVFVRSGAISTKFYVKFRCVCIFLKNGSS
jgi:hypothetical protein